LTPVGGEPVSACGVAANVSHIVVPGVVVFLSPLVGTPDVDEYAYSAALRSRSLADLMGGVPRHNDTDIQLRVELLAAIRDGPSTTDEAMKSKDWRAAMVDELESMKEKKTWSLVDLPRGHKAIGLKWVFKLKLDEHRDIVKHKARLVAKGYV
jgi:hypothetical protein